MIIKSDSLKNLAAALVKAQKEMGAALKDSKNPFFKSKYADLNAVIDASVPALNEAGIAVLQSPGVTAEGTSVINTILMHESGEYVVGQSKVVAAKQNDPQAEGSATTYARRYGLQAMVTLKAEDDDAEGAMNRQQKQETKTTPTKLSNSQTEVVEKAKAQGNGTVSQQAGPISTPETKLVEANPENKVNAVPAKKGWGSKKSNEPKQSGDLY